MVFDTLIIGAGAAGMFAAIAAGERRLKTLLLEKSNKTGVKILMSGGTRCNVTQNTDVKGIVEAFGRNGKFLYPALSKLSPQDVVRWFEQNGVPTKIESTGKIFPRSDKAIDVRNALLNEVENLESVTLKNQSPVESIRREGEFFAVTSSGQVYHAKTVIITSGGKSYPDCGTTGDGYRWAQSLGHSVATPVPALTPIVVTKQWVKDLKGITLPDVRVGVFETEHLDRISETNFSKLAQATCRDSLLFTHFGLSGPAALNVSKAISSQPEKQLAVVIDFVPDEKEEILAEKIKSTEWNNKSPKQFLQHWLPAKLAQAMFEKISLQPDQNLSEISKKKLKKIFYCLKRCDIDIEGTRGFKKAEVTSGGVVLKEVNSHTMESRICPGLFFAGEVLDLDGPIGGFNFQSAFSTGYLAGMNV